MPERRRRASIESKNPDEVLNAIRSGGPGAYLLLGENGLDQEEVAAHVVAEFTNEQTRAFNYEAFRADERECSAEAIAGAAMAYPVLAEVRVVVVRGLEEAREEVGAELARLAKGELPTTLLLLLAEKLDGRKRWVSSLMEHSTVFTLSLPKGKAFVSWVERRAKMQGVAMTDAAAQLLVEYVGSDVYRAASEVEKLALYVLPRTTLDVSDVEAVVGITRDDTVYQLTDCIAKPDPAGALVIAHRMMQADQHPAYLVGMIVRHWQTLRTTIDLIRRKRENDLGELLGEFRPFILDKYLRQARALQLDRIRTGFRLALAAESAIKNGWSPPEVVLDGLICQLSAQMKP